MKIDEGLYQAYLEEMNALENFRMGYAALHPGIHLDHEDPDVRRLIEAMALFTARTRMTGIRNIGATRRRIFQQFFPYLLSPLPSMAILKALPTRQLAETVLLPKGSEVAIMPESGGAAIFMTLKDLRILPVTLVEFKLLLKENRGYRLALRLKSSFPRNDEIGCLRFGINHLNNYEASQHVLYNLKSHLERVSVVFDGKFSETVIGRECRVSFGGTDEVSDDDFTHPLQKERLFFHFPWQELFVNVQVEQPESSWQDIVVYLDLDPDWPRTLVLDKEVFQLFSVPIANQRQAMAQPVSCNGTREHYPIIHPDLEAGFEFHSIRGVYRVDKEGMSPVKPGILSGVAPTYETEEYIDNQGRRRHHLNLHFPQAFEKPKTIAIDASWIQPWFSEVASQRLEPRIVSRSLVGVKWELPVSPVPHAENLFHQNVDGMLHFITLSKRTIIGRDDLMDILLAMGLDRKSQFMKLCNLLVDVIIEKVPMQGGHGSGAMKHRYVLQFRAYDSSQEPIMIAFVEHVENILNAWISGVEIEVSKEFAGREDSSANGKAKQ